MQTIWYNTITEGDKHLTNRAERQEVNRYEVHSLH